jgi:acetylornithine deacetylase/succinyl-diaminopimelate desuccinylase family protein
VDDVTRLLSDLVAIPSVNPMGRPLGGPGVLEGGMSDYLEGWFRALGVRCERETIAPGRDNVLAWYDAPGSGSGTGAGVTLLFDAHQDTVPADGMTIPPFEPRIEGGRLYGRGACDIKGGMAAMLVAFARLVRGRPEGSASVIMACTVDEEFTHIGSSRLAERPLGADLAVVAEPTLLDIVHCHKGAVRWKVRARGVACHSSTPHLGANAIYRMAGVVAALAEHAAELSRAEPHPILGPPSLSVGRIEGGVSVNVVPDACEIEIDRRLIPGERPDAAMERAYRAVARRLGADGTGSFEFLPPWVNMPSLSPESAAAGRWPERVAEALAPVLGRMPGVSGVPYGTDAGPLGAAGLPCLVFGPGDIAQAHTKDEWVDLDQVRTAVDAYERIARELGRP